MDVLIRTILHPNVYFFLLPHNPYFPIRMMIIVIKSGPIFTKDLPYFISIIDFHSSFKHSYTRHLHISEMGSNLNVYCSLIQAPHTPSYYHGNLSSNIGSYPTPNTSNPLLHPMQVPSFGMVYSPTILFPLCFDDPIIVHVGFSLTYSVSFVSIPSLELAF